MWQKCLSQCEHVLIFVGYDVGDGLACFRQFLRCSWVWIGIVFGNGILVGNDMNVDLPFRLGRIGWEGVGGESSR